MARGDIVEVFRKIHLEFAKVRVRLPPKKSTPFDLFRSQLNLDQRAEKILRDMEWHRVHEDPKYKNLVHFIDGRPITDLEKLYDRALRSLSNAKPETKSREIQVEVIPRREPEWYHRDLFTMGWEKFCDLANAAIRRYYRMRGLI